MKRAMYILMISSVLCMGMGSCSTSVEEACRSRMPELHQEFAKMNVEVAALAPARDTNRAIASLTSGQPKRDTIIAERNQVFYLSRDIKDKLQQWSEDKLVETEKYQDMVRTRSDLRPALEPLSELADELVKMDGYVETGKVYQVMASLQRAEAHADEAGKTICSALPATK